MTDKMHHQHKSLVASVKSVSLTFQVLATYRDFYAFIDLDNVLVVLLLS
jgi:hypothetical protein